MAEEKYVSGEEYNVLKAKKSVNNSNPQLNMRVILIIAAIIWTVAIFFIGVAYQKHHTKSSVATTNAPQTNPGGRFGGFGGNFADRTFGTVTAISSTSITVNNTRTNVSSTLTIDSSTTFSENGQTVSASSVTVGETVSIQVDSTNKTIASSIMVLNFQNNDSSTGSSTQTQSN